MSYDFDRITERRGTNAIKWEHYPKDVLPLWVADMDFPAPEPVIAALRARVEHGIFGYEDVPKELLEVVARRMERLYGWQVSPDMIVAIPGVISGVNAAARTVCKPGEGILIQPPVYPPFLKVHKHAGLAGQMAPLKQVNHGHRLAYEINWDIFEAAINSGGARTGMFLLCQPHNPTGQIYGRRDLMHMAEICLQNDILICSDEIHSELLLGGAKHIPIAHLSPEIAERTITLIAPSKTFNIPGLHCGFAIVPNKNLRRRFRKTTERLTMHLSSLSIVAAQAAFSGACDDWLAELRRYLTANRDFVVDYVKGHLPGIRSSLPDATYLAWLDCSDLVKSGKVTGTPYEFFLKRARVALNEGAEFGPGGEGFVRLNFGCPRCVLEEGLQRMLKALR